MILTLATSPLKLKVEFHSVIECTTKDGQTVKEVEKKHAFDRMLADTMKKQLEEGLLRKNWTATSGDRFQKDEIQRWFVIQKRLFLVEGK
jgi:hypothetical protein